MADRDGVYDAATPNGRLLGGMQGIVSDIALHPLRGRLIAGVQHKAQRGDLALLLPAGLRRQDDGVVVKDPDRAVQHAMTWVCQTFLERRSASQVVRQGREHGLRLPRRHRNGETVWRTPTVAAVMAILRHPASAGTFAYGNTQSQVPPGGGRPQQRRQPFSQGKVIVHDRYPASMTWETLARMQASVDDNSATYEPNKRRGIPRQGAALLQGLVSCGRGGHNMVVQYTGGNPYLWNALRWQAQDPVCQRLRADPVDRQVVGAFLEALAPAELDLYEHAREQRRQQQVEVDRAQHSTLQRLEHAAEQARRRSEAVDPAYRLVAAELEQRWEAALQALQEAREQYARLQRRPDKAPEHLDVPPALREALRSLGHSLPTLWQHAMCSRAQRKALRRCLLDTVALDRRAPDAIAVRMVWRGGAVSELVVPCTVGRLADFSDFRQLEAQILRLESQGKADEEIAQLLTLTGFRSAHDTELQPRTVRLIRLRHGRLHRYKGPRPRRVVGALTVPQSATAVGGKPHWSSHLMSCGRIGGPRDEETGLSLLPDRPETLEAFRQRRDGQRTACRD
jgi:hypothetical protein